MTSNVRDRLPTDEIMRMLTKQAIEAATEQLAKEAEHFAKTLPPDATGEMALNAFAAAIRSTNRKLYGGGARA